MRALLQSWETLIVVRVQEAVASIRVYDLLVGVVIAEVNVGFLLDCRIDPAVVDAESDNVDVLAGHGSGVDGGVLLLNVRGKFRAVVATVGLTSISFYFHFLIDEINEHDAAYLGKDGKITAFVFWELRVERLQQFPDVRRSGHRACDVVGAV